MKSILLAHFSVRLPSALLNNKDPKRKVITMKKSIRVSDHQSEPVKIWNAAFINLFFVNLVFNMGQNMTNALLPVYAKSLGASESSIGFLTSSFAISAVIFHIVASPIMDTYNKRNVIAFASFVEAIAFVGFATSKSMPALIGFRLVMGCGMGFGNVCCLAAVSELIPKNKYGAGVGYFSVAVVISQAIGPSFGLWLRDVGGYHTTFFVTAGFMLLSVLLASMLRLNYKRVKKLSLLPKNAIAREALIPASMLLIVTAANGVGNSFLIIYATSRGVANIGIYYTVTALVALCARPLIGRLIDKHGATKIIIPASCSFAFSCIIISFSSSLWHFLIAAFFNALGSSTCQPAFQTLSMKAVSSDRRGAASSTSYVGMDIGGLVGPMIGGYTAQNFGYNMMYRVQAIPYLICMTVVIMSRKWIKKTEAGFTPVKTE